MDAGGLAEVHGRQEPAQGAADALAARAAQGMIAEAGATGTVNVTPTKVTVDVDVPYTPRFIPTGVLTGHGQGTAQIHSNTR